MVRILEDVVMPSSDKPVYIRRSAVVYLPYGLVTKGLIKIIRQ